MGFHRGLRPQGLALWLGLTLLMLPLVACRAEPRLHGTELDRAPAQDFRLINQFGQEVALSDFRGRPVVLTFLFTSCPDVCPLVAERLRLTVNALGDDAARVGMLAVSTDPRNDDVLAAYRFSAAHDLLDRWHFLVGDRSQLEPVWKAYYIAAEPVSGTGGAGGAAPGQVASVIHTDALYLIDKDGRLRSLLRSDFDPAALAADLRMLLQE